jgi:hypothetical protein
MRKLKRHLRSLELSLLETERINLAQGGQIRRLEQELDQLRAGAQAIGAAIGHNMEVQPIPQCIKVYGPALRHDGEHRG